MHARDAWLDHADDVTIRFTSGTINLNAVHAAGDLAPETRDWTWLPVGRAPLKIERRQAGRAQGGRGAAQPLAQVLAGRAGEPDAAVVT